MDHQWVADLVDMQKLASKNKEYKYLLTTVDALSKYALVELLKDNSSTSMVHAFDQVLKRAFPFHLSACRRMKAKNFTIPPYNRTFNEKDLSFIDGGGYESGVSLIGLIVR